MQTIEDVISGMQRQYEELQQRRLQPPTQEQIKQNNLMTQDIAKYGSLQKFTYNGVNCLMKRPLETYWCGYIEHEISSNQFDKLDQITHGGMTASNGFDCAHSGDYPMDLDGEYRDYEYVRGFLERMVDELKKN